MYCTLWWSFLTFSLSSLWLCHLPLTNSYTVITQYIVTTITLKLSFRLRMKRNKVTLIYFHLFILWWPSFLYVDLMLLTYIIFLLPEEQLFNISCRANQLVMSSQSFCLSEKVFISPSFLEDHFEGYRLLGLWIFFSFKIISLCALLPLWFLNRNLL